MAGDWREAGLGEVIPVALKPEPAEFRTKVARRGAAWLSKEQPAPPVKSSLWKNHEHWRDGLDLLAEAYENVCAYSARFIDPMTGARTVDHVQPKSLYPFEAYSWSNLRLACLKMNRRKDDFEDVIDPCTLTQDIFTLNFLTFEISIRRDCPPPLLERANATINRLQLNEGKMRQARANDYRDYSRAQLRVKSPFVYQCAREQGLL